jgi:hypothetical protein
MAPEAILRDEDEARKHSSAWRPVWNAGLSFKSHGCEKRLLSAHVTSLRLEAGGARVRLALVR